MSRLKSRRPSPALVVSIVALVVAMGGSAVAATTLLIHTRNIADGAVTSAKLHDGAVTNHKLANGSVGLAKLDVQLKHDLSGAGSARGVITGPQGPKGDNGSQGPKGDKGDAGPAGPQGIAGRDGFNPALAVDNVPAATAGETQSNLPNDADVGAPGDQGFYFNGVNGASGSATIADGELMLTGNGVDGATYSGGIGIAKAYSNITLADLSALSYQWHVDEANGNAAPTIHVTLTGATADSKFASSGFTNLVYAPGLNGIKVQPGVVYQSDARADGGLWYSTDEPGGDSATNAGSQDDPQPWNFFVSRDTSAKIVQISLDNGGSSGVVSATPFEAGADGLLIGIDGHNSRYDFGS